MFAVDQQSHHPVADIQCHLLLHSITKLYDIFINSGHLPDLLSNFRTVIG
jgi:hypothetical protein